MNGGPAQLDRDGFMILPALIEAAEVEWLRSILADLPADEATRTRRDAAFARRNLLEVPVVRALADGPALRGVVEPVLGPQARPVRGILFDKTPHANWVVPWHQDLSIAVDRKLDLPGYGPWSIKAGVVHVQPPADVLKRMITIRLHLDDCGDDNGPLRVIAGSHLSILTPEQQTRLIETAQQTTCCVPAGGAVLMRPMILHASTPARTPFHRRVIHIEYAAATLPAGLRWAIA